MGESLNAGEMSIISYSSSVGGLQAPQLILESILERALLCVEQIGDIDSAALDT
jgi:hypothetical protein